MPIWLLIKPLADLLPIGLIVRAGLILAGAQILGVDVMGFIQAQLLRSVLGI